MAEHSKADTTRRNFMMAAGSSLVAATAAGAAPLAPPDRQPPKLTLPGPKPKKMGWAIVGLGKLALEEVLPAFSVSEKCVPVALVSGHPEKAKKVADRYGIDPKNIYDYQAFDQIAQNKAVDVVYIILPNSMHAEYTIRGVRAGKHVLCEKPMAASVAECEQMIAAATQADRKLMIANRIGYEPLNRAAFDMAHKKEFGAVRMIESSNVQNVQAPNIRLSKKLAGGPVGDVGIYCIQAARYALNEDPIEVFGQAFSNPADERFREVPETVVFTMRFPSGVLANCGVSFSGEPSRRYRVFCEKGWIEMNPSFSYRGLRLYTGNEKSSQEHLLTAANHFALEMDHFAECIENNKTPRTPGEEGLRDMRVVEAIMESVAAGKPVRIGASA